jgi:hypothetical protein
MTATRLTMEGAITNDARRAIIKVEDWSEGVIDRHARNSAART